MASMQDAAFFCIPEDKLPDAKRKIYCGLCIGFASLGLFGGLWQVYRWRPLLSGYKQRRKPSPNPLVVFSLAVADVLACAGVIGRAVAMLCTGPPEYNLTNDIWTPALHSDVTLTFGYIVEAYNQYVYGVTFMWTLMYAADIYLQLSFKDPPSYFYIGLSWTVPLLCTLGSFLSVAIHDRFPSKCAGGMNLIFHYLFNYLLIISAIVANKVLYLLTARLTRQRMRESGIVSSHNQALMLGLQRKFLAVVFIFTICWIPNVIDSILHIMFVTRSTAPSRAARFFPIWALEAVLNPLQGLLNCFMFGRHVLFRYGRPRDGNIYGSDDMLNESTPILYRSGRT